MLNPSNSVQGLPLKYLDNQLQVNSTPTRFRHTICLQPLALRFAYYLARSYSLPASHRAVTAELHACKSAESLPHRCAVVVSATRSAARSPRPMQLQDHDGRRVALCHASVCPAFSKPDAVQREQHSAATSNAFHLSREIKSRPGSASSGPSSNREARSPTSLTSVALPRCI